VLGLGLVKGGGILVLLVPVDGIMIRQQFTVGSAPTLEIVRSYHHKLIQITPQHPYFMSTTCNPADVVGHGPSPYQLGRICSAEGKPIT
jgi:hypothetical protein